MSGRFGAAVALLFLLLTAPLAVLAVGTIYKLVLGEVEPLVDYLFMYVLPLFVFGSSSALMLIYLVCRGVRGRAIANMVPYVVLGALGSAGFYAWFSADPMIGHSGVDFGAVVFGLVLGSLFGATFAWILTKLYVEPFRVTSSHGSEWLP